MQRNFEQNVDLEILTPETNSITSPNRTFFSPKIFRANCELYLFKTIYLL